MLPVLPSPSDLEQLASHRDEASVTIYVPSSPIPRERDEARIAFKSCVADAARQLKATGANPERAREVISSLEALDMDEEFWMRQARGLAVFASPGLLQVYRLLTDVKPRVSVNHRFDIGTLLRAVTFSHAAYVLTLSEGRVQLFGVTNDSEPARELQLSLPDDLHSVLEYTTTEDQLARGRALGANGEKTEQQRYCRLVQDAVLARVGNTSLPLILAASKELGPAYRAINTYQHLCARGIDANPEGVTVPQLTDRARAVLDELNESDTKAWSERYETQRAKDRATSDLGHVARAATASAIDELVFDMDAALSGSIDDDGTLHLDHEPTTGSYGVIDEIAARVLRSDGRVRALRTEDVPNGSPVAAILRYPF
ncbi:hypothetical protein [Salinibacterium sp. ZJ454]|uniref:baeRF11 domain-containing protein n=1 Tax=Salinibacterium sp. ZJ454 TaxID=2708339 RepID=UPI0014225232|nr:hypothetical protein [Salinibacterium sp. ZJ454]